MISSVTIRPENPSDATALRQLAELDSARPLSGHVLVADVGGELWAAIESDGGRVVADPFRPSGELVDLLRVRVNRTRGTAPAAHRLALRPRLAGQS